MTATVVAPPHHSLHAQPPPARGASLMEGIVSPCNVDAARRRVQKKGGTCGVDRVRTDELQALWAAHGDAIRADILAHAYEPAPVRMVPIPKPAGGARWLGIPTVLDRLVQRAIHQIVEPLVDPALSTHAYGYRSHRGAPHAALAGETFVRRGCSWVLDLDVRNFFDEIDHAILRERVAALVPDERVATLMCRFATAPASYGGRIAPRDGGVPQGAPLSPLLANAYLDALDRELERLGHPFVRYADDVNVYATTQDDARAILATVETFLDARLHLRLNAQKTSIDRPWNRPHLGTKLLFREDGDTHLVGVHRNANGTLASAWTYGSTRRPATPTPRATDPVYPPASQAWLR